MTRVFLADPQAEERSALRLLLNDIKMAVVGEAADWPAALTQIPLSCPDMVLIDRKLLPAQPCRAITKLRASCPQLVYIILLLNTLDFRQEVELASAVDLLINKQESPHRIAERLRLAACSACSRPSNPGLLTSMTAKKRIL